MSDSAFELSASDDVRQTPVTFGAFLMGLLVLTGLATGVGGLLGLHLAETVQNSIAQKTADDQAGPHFAAVYTSNAQLRTLTPMVTNLAAPRGSWIRLQASVVLSENNLEDAGMLVSRIEEDILAYLRTITLSQIEGAGGLQHLREDLNERAITRSDGRVRELILESLVIQ